MEFLDIDWPTLSNRSHPRFIYADCCPIVRIRHPDILELVFSGMPPGTVMVCTLFVGSNVFFIFN